MYRDTRFIRNQTELLDTRNLSSALRRRVAEALVERGGEELPLLAEELLSSLLHAKPSAADEAHVETLRAKALIALLARAPLPAGAAAAKEFYSPHVDVSQRLLVLDTMAAAAERLAGGGSLIG
eukprot:4957664-Pyramimonas_sp.AAC.1